MSYQGLFSKVVFVAAVAASAAAEAQSPSVSGGGAVMMMGAGSSSMSERRRGESLSVRNLRVFHSEAKTRPFVDDCTNRLFTADTSVAQMSEQQADATLGCVNQKIVEAFLAKPAENNKDVAKVIWQNRPYMNMVYSVKDDVSYASKMAMTCQQGSGQANVQQFIQCVDGIMDAETSRNNKLLLGVIFAVCAVPTIGVIRAVRRHRQELNSQSNDNNGPQVV